MMMAVRKWMTSVIAVHRRMRRRHEATEKRGRRRRVRVRATKHNTPSVTHLLSVLVRMHGVRMRGVESNWVVMLLAQMLVL
jgi:hypothetical protein